MNLTPIPLSFIQQQTSLSWREALWAYQHKFIGPDHIVKLAQENLSLDSSERQFELSSTGKSAEWRILELLEQLATAEVDELPSSVTKKWLFLILAWIFENKDQLCDPLGEVEKIYAEFDYPHEIEKFVRYMPTSDDYHSDQHSYQANTMRLFKEWKQYLEVAKQNINKISRPYL
ncbi:DUF2247 family protein [Herbaspirillum sp. YR522]|uniref:DUF2247 family protein n=1 Tax=Herbaspirillum sp. YR522 TaxID=1144342 RepID=UPI0009D9ED66|nr:DUF2247 family protein [Herbaspirillum sp. YR522]